jgi:hypothetical protein
MLKKLPGVLLVIAMLTVPIASASTSPANVDGGVPCTGKSEQEFCGGILCILPRIYYYKYVAATTDIEKVTAAAPQTVEHCIYNYCTHIFIIEPTSCTVNLDT